MQFFALVQDNLDGIHEQSCDVRAIPTMQQLLKAAQLNTGRKKIRCAAASSSLSVCSHPEYLLPLVCTSQLLLLPYLVGYDNPLALERNC